MSNTSRCMIVFLISYIPLLIFCLLILSATEGKVLKSPIDIMDLTIYLWVFIFFSVSFCIHVYYLCLHDNLTYGIVKYLSIFNNIPSLKVYSNINIVNTTFVYLLFVFCISPNSFNLKIVQSL